MVSIGRSLRTCHINIYRLIKRSTIIARLLYHTARILLTKTNPVESEYSAEMQTVQQSHARDICGIVAHSRDRYVDCQYVYNELVANMTQRSRKSIDSFPRYCRRVPGN